MYKNRDLTDCFALLQFNMEKKMSFVQRDVQLVSERLGILENAVKVLEINISSIKDNGARKFKFQRTLYG